MADKMIQKEGFETDTRLHVIFLSAGVARTSRVGSNGSTQTSMEAEDPQLLGLMTVESGRA
eukprot:3565841-Amphidinium_carterae.2